MHQEYNLSRVLSKFYEWHHHVCTVLQLAFLTQYVFELAPYDNRDVVYYF